MTRLSLSWIFVIGFMCSGNNAMSEQRRPTSVVVYSYGRLYWTLRDDFGGEDTSGFKVRRFFVGDEIWAKLLFTTSSVEPIQRQVFESALQCLDVALYEIPDGKMAHVWSGKYTPKYRGRLGSVMLDSKDPGYNKPGYRSTEGASDGVFTEWFDMARLLGGSVPPGIYQFAVILNPSCSTKFNFQGYGQGDLSVIQIHEANTPELKAMKLCWEGVKKLSPDPTGRSVSGMVIESHKMEHDIDLIGGLAKEYFLPALAIKPDLKCALRNLAQYCKLQGDKECYKKYQKANCRASTPGVAAECRSRMEAELRYWNVDR